MGDYSTLGYTNSLGDDSTLGEYSGIRYSIWDPTGNITALVESPTKIERQPQVAAALMMRHPEIEQVGFVGVCGEDSGALLPDRSGGRGQIDTERIDFQRANAALRMAGGEFCGNASLCAGAWFLSRERENFSEEKSSAAMSRETGAGPVPDEPGDEPVKRVLLKVSGARETVEVTLTPLGGFEYEGSVKMPPALGISEREFAYDCFRGCLAVVELEGISHIIIEPDSEFAALANNRAAAEDAVRLWCGELGADGLGLMFVKESRQLTPLVYVPGSGTVFWENSCASGTSAVGMAFAKNAAEAVDLTFEEPGGRLRVLCDPAGPARLCGRVSFRGSFVIS